MARRSRPPRVASVEMVVVGSGRGSARAAIAADEGGVILSMLKLSCLLGTRTAVRNLCQGFCTPGCRSVSVRDEIANDGVATCGRWHGRRAAEHRSSRHRLSNAAGYCKVTLQRLATEAGPRTRPHPFVLAASSSRPRTPGASDGSELAGKVDPAQTLTTSPTASLGFGHRRTVSKPKLRRLINEAAGRSVDKLPRREGSDQEPPIEETTATITTSPDFCENRLDESTCMPLFARWSECMTMDQTATTALSVATIAEADVRGVPVDRLARLDVAMLSDQRS